MLGTLRRLAAKVAAVFTRPKAPATPRYQGPPIPLRRSLALHAIRGAYGAHLAAMTGTDDPHHYPEWRCARKPKGKRDHSQKVRSNRRKAAAKARVR